MRASALEKLKLERKVCQEDNLTYSTSPKKKVELDAKILENKIEEEEISQDELKSFLMPDLKSNYNDLMRFDGVNSVTQLVDPFSIPYLYFPNSVLRFVSIFTRNPASFEPFQIRVIRCLSPVPSLND